MTDKFYVYVLHHVGNRTEWREFTSYEECVEFVFRYANVGEDDPDCPRTLRVFSGRELTWKPRDVVKSIDLVLKGGIEELKDAAIKEINERSQGEPTS